MAHVMQVSISHHEVHPKGRRGSTNTCDVRVRLIWHKTKPPSNPRNNVAHPAPALKPHLLTLRKKKSGRMQATGTSSTYSQYCGFEATTPRKSQ